MKLIPDLSDMLTPNVRFCTSCPGLRPKLSSQRPSRRGNSSSQVRENNIRAPDGTLTATRNFSISLSLECGRTKEKKNQKFGWIQHPFIYCLCVGKHATLRFFQVNFTLQRRVQLFFLASQQHHKSSWQQLFPSPGPRTPFHWRY